MKKAPWGILASVCAHVVLYLTIGVTLAFVILDKIAAQTNDTASFFGTWWQVLLFIADIVFAGLCGFCFYMFLKKRKLNKEVAIDEI